MGEEALDFRLGIRLNVNQFRPDLEPDSVLFTLELAVNSRRCLPELDQNIYSLWFCQVDSEQSLIL